MSTSNELSIEEKLFERIKELQDKELSLYQRLESLSTSSPNEDEISSTIAEINQTTKLRDTLYEKLGSDLNKSADTVGSLSQHLQDQIETTNVIESQIQKARERAEQIRQTKKDTNRMVQLGQYEAARYKAHKDFIKLMIYFLLGLLAVVALLRYNIIPSILATGLITIIVVLALIMGAQKIYDLKSRSNLDYAKYDWNFDREQANKGYGTVWEHDDRALERAEGEVEDEIPGLNDPKYAPGLMTTIYESDADGKIGDYIEKRISPTVNYPYGTEVVPSREYDYYVKFTGLVLHKPNYEKVEFRVGSDDGSRLTVDGRVEIRNWRLEGYEKKTSREIPFKRDMPIELEMYQHRGGRALTLEWRVNGGEFEIIPEKHLVHIE
jgi:hypothetical protein